ncbi:MAG: 1-(5-phosphoribosyl)-5-[(5-phosphoribosylamino)methylideneamino]imidazole-4-carboxamide isomerase [Proteobacteria bacterium]|nr:1-(5-phosphoribosyl)-5-[(5-phosphoribosylamino)methylideneamino]imidazole-4-carboxamide isomerase [Pseudomonadota bacterium]MCZ6785313.1 1-(5-phosphoribosyl)-5-[(5-phosphoribosylamino)methylideneamino]imidazole-4-carboxamide isomerase [Pseudomonadota bacterium]
MADFEIIPAIDLLGGQCVRLRQGRYEDATVYDANPAAAAERFVAHPIRRLHVVDLEAAKTGSRANGPSIAAIAAVASGSGVPVQLGGGVRDRASIDAALALGVDRVILGTVALRNPPFVREAAEAHPGRIVVGIDGRDGFVSVEGWTETSEATVEDLARRFEDAGAAALVYTDIGRDGMLEGPSFDATSRLAESVSIPVILSGGVASEDDLVRAATLAPRGVVGAIVGRALYTGAVDLGRALARLGCS